MVERGTTMIKGVLGIKGHVHEISSQEEARSPSSYRKKRRRNTNWGRGLYYRHYNSNEIALGYDQKCKSQGLVQYQITY